MRSSTDVAFELLCPKEAVTYTNFVWAFDGTPQELSVRGGQVVERSSTVAPVGTSVDLGGRLVAPAFIDPHCHILPAGLDMLKLDLGAGASASDVLDLVRERHLSLPEGDWLMAVQYDQTKFDGGKHLTRHDLDAISPDRPILLRHSNGHASIANSAMLAAAGVDQGTRDPKGGTYGRDPDGTPNGVLLERAHEAVTASVPAPSIDQMVEAILRVADTMASLGIVEATDMMTGRYDLKRELTAYRIAAERGCPIRTRLCIQWAEALGPRAKKVAEEVEALDGDRVAIWGLKIFADGAIGSATAAIHGSYDSDPTSNGTLIYTPQRLKNMVFVADDLDFAVAIHTIGDRSTDLVMEAIGGTSNPSNHRIEHAMLMSDLQIERMARLGCHCSMQPEFLYRFGHAYRYQLGAERASRLNRYRSVKAAGVPLSFSSDRPIVSGDPWLGVFAGCNRPDGFDPSEALTLEEALRAYTTMGSIANKGLRHELLQGDRAEMIVFSL